MYKHIVRPLLSILSPEAAHKFVLSCLSFVGSVPGGRTAMKFLYSRKSPALSREEFGITFKNPIGLAAGMDANGDMYNNFAALGFGFVEIGSLTLEPYRGNPKPRLFRVPQKKAIVNRMGSENKGVKYAINHLRSDIPDVVIAANIEASPKSKKPVSDYMKSFSLLYDFVDMFTINISNPLAGNTEKMQTLQFMSDVLDPILGIRLLYDDYKPILVKISPDIDHDHLAEILDWCMLSGIDGIVAGNASRNIDLLELEEGKKTRFRNAAISGAPLFPKSLELVKFINKHTKGRFPIIGVGGIMTPSQAKEMLDAGASLIEMYTGFVYEGPKIVKKTLKALSPSD